MNRKKHVYEKYIKRLIDIVLSLIAIIILSPILIVIALLVRTKLGSPVLFNQKRVGLDGKIFVMHKFRTMTNGTDKDGNLLSDQERLTPFGKALRRSSLDELPELFNILRGELSLIGPRPYLPEYLPYYTEEEMHRHDVRPGLSGLAQVNGRNASSWEESFAWDLKYVNNITFVQDIKIIFLTLYKVVKKADILMGDEKTVGRLDDERRKR